MKNRNKAPVFRLKGIASLGCLCLGWHWLQCRLLPLIWTQTLEDRQEKLILLVLSHLGRPVVEPSELEPVLVWAKCLQTLQVHNTKVSVIQCPFTWACWLPSS